MTTHEAGPAGVWGVTEATNTISDGGLIDVTFVLSGTTLSRLTILHHAISHFDTSDSRFCSAKSSCCCTCHSPSPILLLSGGFVGPLKEPQQLRRDNARRREHG